MWRACKALNLLLPFITIFEAGLACDLHVWVDARASGETDRSLSFQMCHQNPGSAGMPGPSEHIQTETERSKSALATKAKQLYSWCQMDGPAYWRFSHSEIQQLLCSGDELPKELQDLVEKR